MSLAEAPSAADPAPNVPPSLTWEGGSAPSTLLYLTGAAPLAPFAKLLLSDPDSTTLPKATVTVSGYHAGEERLALTTSAATGDVAGFFDMAKGALTLTSAGGQATLAQWQAAFRAVTFTAGGDETHLGTRDVTVTIGDPGPTSPRLLAYVGVGGGDGADHLVHVGGWTGAGGGDDVIRLDPAAQGNLDGQGGVNTVDVAGWASGAQISVGGMGSVRSGSVSVTLQNIQNAVGTAYDDTISGGLTGSTILAGAGDDTLTFGGGPTRLDGGAGYDAVTFNGSQRWVAVDLRLAGPQNVDGQGPLLTLTNVERVYGSLHDDTLIGDAGNNGFIGGGGRDLIDGGDGNDWLGFYGYTTAVQVSLANADWQDLGPGGAVKISNFEALFGTQFNDTLTGDARDNYLGGGPGNDTLTGGGGFDTADYKDGYTYASGITVDLGVTGAQNTGAAGVDTLVNIRGLVGTALNDTLTGDARDNVISGWSGNDLIAGGAGNDLLRHGDPNVEGTVVYGNDTFTGGAGNDTVEGGSGHDVAVYSGARSDYIVSLGAQGWTITDNRSGSPDGSDIVRNVETLRFSDGDVGARHVGPLDGGVAHAVRSLLREDPVTSHAADLARELSFRVITGQATTAEMVAEVVLDVRPTASVATMAYQFFTGGTPSAAGMDYLVASTGPNPNNLNSGYYQSFSMENRYINFAVNLGKVGAGHTQFEAQYGALSLFDATRKAYETIFGGAPDDAKVHALLDPTANVGGVSMTRAQYFAYYGQDGANGIGTKAAMVGWLLTEAVKADLGTYAKSNDAFLTDVAMHDAPFAVDMIGHYAQPAFVFHPG